MPNHIRNVWKIKNIKPDQLTYFVNKFTVITSSKDDRTTEPQRIIDFDLIIPEPRFKKDCPKDSLVNKDSRIEEYKDRPWFDWYNYHIKHWGTKWNAYDGYTKIGKTQFTMVFSTAWSFPEPIAIASTAICEQNDLDLEIKYADEDWGSNCGTLTYNHETKDMEFLIEKDIGKDPRKFARDLWNRY